jgi:hypothetical protein
MWVAHSMFLTDFCHGHGARGLRAATMAGLLTFGGLALLRAGLAGYGRCAGVGIHRRRRLGSVQHLADLPAVVCVGLGRGISLPAVGIWQLVLLKRLRSPGDPTRV